MQVTEEKTYDFDLTEIIGGEEIMSPSFFTSHQEIVANLYFAMRKHVENNPTGRLFISPIDVIFEEEVNRVQPDILYVKNENLKIVKEWIRDVPDLVVEMDIDKLKR